MSDTNLSLFDFAALRYFGREQAPNELSSMKLCTIPISMRTVALLFARYDLLMGLRCQH